MSNIEIPNAIYNWYCRNTIPIIKRCRTVCRSCSYQQYPKLVYIVNSTDKIKYLDEGYTCLNSFSGFLPMYNTPYILDEEPILTESERITIETKCNEVDQLNVPKQCPHINYLYTINKLNQLRLKTE